MTPARPSAPGGTAGHTRRCFAVACLLVIVLVPAFYAWAWPQAPMLDGDSQQYMEVAADLTDFRLDRAHIRSPGYPVVLALTGASSAPTRTLLVVSLVLHGLSICLLLSVLRAAEVPHRWLAAFGVLAALPPNVELAGYVLTENLTQFGLALGVAALVWWRTTRRHLPLACAAVALGYCGVTRPVYQFLGPAIAGCLIVWAVRASGRDRAQTLRAAGALVAGTALIAGGLSIYNWRSFGYAGVAPTLGFHLSTKTILFVERAPDEFAHVRDILIRERAAELVKPGGLHDGSQTIWAARAVLEDETGLSTVALSSYLVRMNVALIARAPVAFLRDVALSAARYWLPASGPLAGFDSAIARTSWLVVHALVAGTLMLQVCTLVGLAVIAAGRRIAGQTENIFASIRANDVEWTSYVLAGVVVAYTMALTCLLDIGEPRQRRSTDLLILFMSILGAHVWRRTFVAPPRLRHSPPGPGPFRRSGSTSDGTPTAFSGRV